MPERGVFTLLTMYIAWFSLFFDVEFRYDALHIGHIEHINAAVPVEIGNVERIAVLQINQRKSEFIGVLREKALQEGHVLHVHNAVVV